HRGFRLRWVAADGKRVRLVVGEDGAYPVRGAVTCGHQLGGSCITVERGRVTAVDEPAALPFSYGLGERVVGMGGRLCVPDDLGLTLFRGDLDGGEPAGLVAEQVGAAADGGMGAEYRERVGNRGGAQDETPHHLRGNARPVSRREQIVVDE